MLAQRCIGTIRRSRGLQVRGCAGCIIASHQACKDPQLVLSIIPRHNVVRVIGRTIPPVPIRPDFPGTYPRGFFHATTGARLPNDATFSQEFRAALEAGLKTKAPLQHEEFMREGTINDRLHQWVVLRLPAGTYFPVHAHPGLEMVYIVSGTMHEIRLHGKQPAFKPVVGVPGPDISHGCEFVEQSFGPGTWLVNEVGSIHQSFSKDEDITLVALWPSGYVFFPPEHLPHGVFKPVNHNVGNEVCWNDDRDF